MQQTQDTKRNSSGLRWALGVLVVMLCLQGSLRVTEAASNQTHLEDTDIQGPVLPRKNKRGRETVHLLTAVGPNEQKVPALHENGIYIWRIINTKTIFKLEDSSTALVVPKKGLYFVNLKMYYRISATHKCTDKLFLSTSIKVYQPSYLEWIDVITGMDTMQCIDNWYQSVTLSQVVRLEKGAKLRVIIDPKTYDFIDGNEMTYFSVTLL